MTTGSFPGNCFIQLSVRDERFKLISNPRPGTDNLIAGSYLDESHQFFVESGATSADQAGLAPLVRAVFNRWLRPPRYELYDLKNDAGEWQNLADEPRYREIKNRLIGALAEMQVQTRDPFLDPANVEEFVADQLSHRDLAYNKTQGFRWPYLDAFPAWRARSLKTAPAGARP